MNVTFATDSDKAKVIGPGRGILDVARYSVVGCRLRGQERVSGHGRGMEAAVRPVTLGVHAIHVLLKEGGNRATCRHSLWTPPDLHR